MIETAVQNRILSAYQQKQRISHIARDEHISWGTVRKVLINAGQWNGPQPVPRVMKSRALDDRIQALESKLAELKAKKAYQALRFEWMDETTITVYGVTSDFVQNEGMARLLQEIEHRVPQRRLC